jgi:hypothetical protein
VTDVRGGAVTVTLKLQDAVCRLTSTALHVTPVDPIGKLTPLGGMHVVVIGAVPPAAIGGAYVTGTGCPVGDGSVCAAGHIRVIAGGFDGVTGLLPHWTAPIALRITAAKRRLDGNEGGKLQETPYRSMRVE